MTEKKYQDEGLFEDKEINLRELFDSIIDNRNLVIAVTAFFAICSIIYSLFVTELYRSDAILSLKDESSSNSQSGLASIAQVAGLNFNAQSENKAAVVIETVQSREFVKHLITFEGVLPNLMAFQSFDKENETTYFDSNRFDYQTKAWIKTPSLTETHREYLKSNLNIYQDKSDTGFLYVSITHPSPIFSKNFLNLIVSEMNELVRRRDLKESEDALNYLKEELSNTKLLEMKQSINFLIQNQLEKQMLARISDDYVFRIIEPPFLPEEKIAPKRRQVTFLGTALGFILSCTYILICLGLGYKPKTKLLQLKSSKEDSNN